MIKKLLSKKQSICLLIFAMVYSISTNAQVTLDPIADTFVKGGDEVDNNFGADDEIWMKTPNDGAFPSTRRGYFKFDLSGLTGSITSATLRLTTKELGTNGTDVETELNAYLLADDTFVEGTGSQANQVFTPLNWNSEPAPFDIKATVPNGATPIGTVTLDATDDPGDSFDIVITAAAMQELAGDKTLSIVITSSSVRNLQVFSKEGSTTQGPKLILGGVVLGLEDQLLDDESVKIYPNPVNSESIVSLYLNDTSKTDIALFDINGKKVSDYSFSPQASGEQSILWKDIVENKSITNGMYFVKIKQNQNIKTQKIFISN